VIVTKIQLIRCGDGHLLKKKFTYSVAQKAPILLTEFHKVGNDLNVGVKDSILPEQLLYHIADSGTEAMKRK